MSNSIVEIIYKNPYASLDVLIEEVEKAIKDGADLNEIDSNGQKAWFHIMLLANENKNNKDFTKRVVEMVLDRIDQEEKDKALHTAAYYGWTEEIVKLVIPRASYKGLTEALNQPVMSPIIKISGYQKIRELLEEARDNHTEHVSKKINPEDYKQNLAKVEELYNEYIQPCYDREVTYSELQKSIESVYTHPELRRFRSNYQYSRLLSKPKDKKHKNITDKIEKLLDREVIPTYKVLESLVNNKELNSDGIKIQFIENHKLGYDALLIIGEEKIRLDVTRAINDGEQEKHAKQKLAKEGSALTQINDKDYEGLLLNAYKEKYGKQQKKKSEGKELYDWLIIAIDMAPQSADPDYPKQMEKSRKKALSSLKEENLKCQEDLKFKEIFVVEKILVTGQIFIYKDWRELKEKYLIHRVL